MTDLNELLKDFIDNRLAYKQVYREKFEALLTGMVSEIEALKVYAVPRLPAAPFEDTADLPKAAIDKIVSGAVAEHAAKRGPGRPPKAEAA